MSFLKRFNSWEWRRRLHASWYPELALFPSPKIAGEVYRKVGLRGHHSLIVALPSLVIGRVFGSLASPIVGPLGGALVSILVYVGVFLICVRALSRRTHLKLRQALVERGVGICIPCGYDLRGQTEPRCPECGASFDSALLSHGPEGDEASEPKKVDDDREAETMSG